LLLHLAATMNVDIAALKHSTSTFLGSPSVFPDELHAAELYGDLETLACKSTCNPSTGNVKKQAVDGQSVYGQATTAAPEQGRIAIRKREQPDPVEELSNRTSPGKKMRPSALLGVTLHPSTAPESEGSCQPFSAIVIHFDIDTDTVRCVTSLVRSTFIQNSWARRSSIDAVSLLRKIRPNHSLFLT